MVHGQLVHDRDRLGRALVGQIFQGAGKSGAGLLVPSEECLHACTGAGQPRAHCVVAVGRDRQGIEQDGVAVGVASGRRQRSRACEEKLDALLHHRGRRQQAQCLREPVRGACRREPDRLLAGLAQDGRGGDVALACRALDVMGARRSRSTPRSERLGAALVGHEPPPAGRCVVDGPANERMSKAEAPRHVSRAK